MHSTRIPGNAQQQTVSIRVSNSLREFLERSKDVIARDRGESVSISDVARILLESARNDRLDSRFEVADLQQDPTHALWAIRKKWRNVRHSRERSGFCWPTMYSLPVKAYRGILRCRGRVRSSSFLSRCE